MANNAAHAALRITAGEHPPVWLAVLPMFHPRAASSPRSARPRSTARCVTVPQVDAALALQLVEEEGVTTTNIVPTLLIAMLDEPSYPGRERASLHSVMLGGTSIAPEYVRACTTSRRPLGHRLRPHRGAAVVTMTTAGDTVDDQVHTCGAPLPGVEVAIADPETGERRAVGEDGEVWTRGFHTMRGYLDDPSATARALDGDGWLHTGDLGSLDARGYLRIAGRATDMIIRGGENIYPREVEDALYQEDDVVEVAVVGLPDAYYGEVAAAFVRRRPGSTVTGEDLAVALGERLTGHKVPTEWYFVDEFPLTPSGKVQKFALRDAWARGEHAERGG